MPHIIVTGPESTGKTTLSRQLAEHFGGVWIPEYPRAYLEAAGRRGRASDFRHFVSADQHLVEAAKAQVERTAASAFIVQDTGVEVLSVWYADKFGPVPPFITEALMRRGADVYVLCRPDLPWVYDALREDPHRRSELFARLRSAVDGLGSPIVEVSGFDESRLAEALAGLRGMTTNLATPT